MSEAQISGLQALELGELPTFQAAQVARPELAQSVQDLGPEHRRLPAQLAQLGACVHEQERRAVVPPDTVDRALLVAQAPALAPLSLSLLRVSFAVRLRSRILDSIEHHALQVGRLPTIAVSLIATRREKLRHG